MDSRDEAAAGLPIGQEPKYTVNGSSIVNRASGEPIPEDEPVFIFRGRDVHARVALAAYLLELPQGEHAAAVDARYQDFARFAVENRERMKEPDTERAAEAEGRSSLPLYAEVCSLRAEVASWKATAQTRFEWARTLERQVADLQAAGAVMCLTDAQVKEALADVAEREDRRQAAEVHESWSYDRSTGVWEPPNTEAEEADLVSSQIVRFLRTLAAERPTHRHRKRGGLYIIRGRGMLQTEKPLADETTLLVYQDASGALFFRTPEEFEDGRFEALPAGIAPHG
jgi:hypothetical protein